MRIAPISVGQVANAMETYSYYKNKVNQDEMDLIETRIFDSAYDSKGCEQKIKIQETQLDADRQSLCNLLNTDICKVPPFNPSFKQNACQPIRPASLNILA